MLIERMSSELGLPEGYLRSIARSASHRYKEYRIPKRQRGYRKIFHPARELKSLQRWLLRTLVLRLPVHTCAMGYRRGLGPAANARLHLGQRFLLRMDLEEFFPSIKLSDVRRYFKVEEGSRMGETWSKEDLWFIGAIVCRNGELTIGAPTSPAVSNALCYQLDDKLSMMAEVRGVRYSRYADDLFFSTEVPDVLRAVEEETRNIVGRLDFPKGLRINSSKTRHASKKGQMRVTGLVLTPQGHLSLGRSRKRWLRSLVYRYAELSSSEKEMLAGWLAYARDVEPRLIERLILKYGAERVRQARGLADAD